MKSEFRCRFIIVDLGPPMAISTIKNLINSLQNALSLALIFSPRPNEINFGISILNSDFVVFQSESDLRKNFHLLTKNLNILLKQTSGRVTVQEYKILLRKSIETSLRQSQEKFKKAESPDGQSNFMLIQIAVVTKKNVCVVADVLSDVISKLQKTVKYITSVKTFKVVQISTEATEKNCGTSEKNSLINWIVCADNVYDLSHLFKEWLLNPQQQLRILLSKDLNLEVKCDVDDFVISLDFFYRVRSKGSTLSLVSDISKENQYLEIVQRLPVNGLCATLVFGTPRRICASNSSDSSWTEMQINKKIFQELCRELNRTGQGLLAKSVLTIESRKIINFHFLTSDGNMLLMNDVAPHELYFPKQSEDSDAVQSCEDEGAASLVKSSLQKIVFFSEYTPDNFKSGVYEVLRDILVKSVQNKDLFGCFDSSNFKLFGKKTVKKKNLKSPFDSTNDMDDPVKNEKRKKAKLDINKELQNVHPALLTPNIVEKYRKVHPDAFIIPELSRDYNENLA